MRGKNGLIPVVLTFLLLTASAQTIYGQTIFSPEVETACGYESNRFSSSNNAVGSAYALALPEARLIWFISDTDELNLSASYLRREYLKDEASFISETRGSVYYRKRFSKLYARFKLNVGEFTDKADSGDDNLWIEFFSKGTYKLSSDLRVSTSFKVERSNYRSLRTFDGDKQKDTRWRLRPGVTYYGFSNVTLWAETTFTYKDSNESFDEYRKLGATIGLDIYLTEEIPVGVWFDLAQKDYLNRDEYASGGQRDTPVSFGVWSGYRFTPWMEGSFSAEWLTYQSNDRSSEYDSWSVEIGLEFIKDFELPWW